MPAHDHGPRKRPRAGIEEHLKTCRRPFQIMAAIYGVEATWIAASNSRNEPGGKWRST